jgi:hypothetical protein
VKGILSIPRRIPLYSTSPPSFILIMREMINRNGREQMIKSRDSEELKIAFKKNGSLEYPPLKEVFF